jgi:hypothetical protein
VPHPMKVVTSEKSLLHSLTQVNPILNEVYSPVISSMIIPNMGNNPN